MTTIILDFHGALYCVKDLQLTDCKVVLAGQAGHAHALDCAANEMPHRRDLHMYVVPNEVR